VAEIGRALRAAGLRFGELGAAMAAGDGSAASSADDERLSLIPVTLAKGLEFDDVVLVEPSRIATGETYGLRRLYVALTRAVSRLTVIHAEPLPMELLLRTIEQGHWGDLSRSFFAWAVCRRGSGIDR
jgi:superfamily I DNA/RNA helicase